MHAANSIPPFDADSGPTISASDDQPAGAVQVPIGLLRNADSPRLSGENIAHIGLLAETDATLPPILVHRRTMRVLDGVHRWRAAIRRGAHTVSVRFLDGSLEEAFVAAVRVNVRHGLPLTLPDRKAAAARIMTSFPSWSDRAIADAAGLSAGTVAAIRGETGSRVIGRIGRDGRVRSADTDRRRRMASEIIARRPGASLREIASATGISPTTARDVRERLKRGENPVPPQQRQHADEPAGTSRVSSAVARGTRSTGSTTTEDVEVILRRLQKDPSLRFNEAGRALLRWLTPRAVGPRDWSRFADAVPPHCRYTLAELARACADGWQRLAQQLEHEASDP
jgi:ParB-like nuclease domain